MSQAPSICETGKLSNSSNKCVPHLEYCNSWALQSGSMQTQTENLVLFNALKYLLQQGPLTEAKIIIRNFSLYNHFDKNPRYHSHIHIYNQKYHPNFGSQNKIFCIVYLCKVYIILFKQSSIAPKQLIR